MSNKLDQLATPFRDKVKQVIEQLKVMGINVIPTSCYRSIEEQDKLYAQGRTASGDIVTKAKGGQSPHNFRLACDLCPVNPKDGSLWWTAPDDVWHAMHEIGEQLGLNGGWDWNFKDAPHYEDKDWKVTQAAWRQGNWKA